MMEKLTSAISLAERTFGTIRYGIAERSESLEGLTTSPARSVCRTMHMVPKEPSTYHLKKMR